jgi:PEP-CTERM motif
MSFMIKQLFAVAAVAAATLPAQALTAGDLAFTSFNADEDGFAMVALADVAAGTKVYFSDNEWTGSAFNSGESFSSWTSGAAIVSAGTVIRFSKTDSATLLAASVGTLSRETVSGSSNYGFSQSEDTLYAYLGSSATMATTFLAAVSTSTYGSTAGGSLSGTGLGIGAGAVQLAFGSDYAEYSGDRSLQTTFAGYKPLVSDVALWADSGDGSFANRVPDTTSFTTAVPEPGTYALLLAGLAAVGFVARRRS